MFDETLEERIQKLKNKFEIIKSKGYIMSNNIGRGNIGLTFEKLIGKENDNLPVADIDGIEIKVKHGFSKTVIALFSLVPKGETFFETKRIREKFGYPDKDFNETKVINRYVWSKYKNKLDSGYKVSFIVSYNDQKVYLCFYDDKDKLIDKESYWEFEDIKQVLFRKMNILALVKAWPKRVNSTYYYKYYDINFYKLKSFYNFLELIESKKIILNIQLGVFKSGPKKGKEHDRGIAFCIRECDLLELYDEYDIC